MSRGGSERAGRAEAAAAKRRRAPRQAGATALASVRARCCCVASWESIGAGNRLIGTWFRSDAVDSVFQSVVPCLTGLAIDSKKLKGGNRCWQSGSAPAICLVLRALGGLREGRHVNLGRARQMARSSFKAFKRSVQSQLRPTESTGSHFKPLLLHI